MVSSQCVIKLFLLYAFFFFQKKEKFHVTATEHLRQTGKNETKLNANKNMRTYLLCMEKGKSSVDEKLIKE